jgi:TIR domain
MAIWQCDYYLIPEKIVRRRLGVIPMQLTKQRFNNLCLGRKPWCPPDYAKQLGELLPEFPSWTSALRWWGTENGDRIDVFEVEGGISEVFVRFDLRRLNTVLMRRVADLARGWNCMFCSAEDLRLVRATGPSILRHISESRTLRTAWAWFGEKIEDNAAEAAQVFICHASEDKPFVRVLARDLKAHGVPVWFDEWVLQVGDSLTEKIQEGIQRSGWLLVILSKSSVRSRWVRRELSSGLALELEKKGVYVLPVLKESCKIPLFLKDKLYADFRKPYRDGLELLLRRLAA